MSLIKCTECGKEFSDKASSCPNCGCPAPSTNFQSQNSYQPNLNSKPPIKKKSSKKGIIIAVVALIIFAAALGNLNKGKGNSSQTSSPKNSSSSSGEETSTTAPTAVPEITNYAINDTAKLNDFDITLTKVDITDSISMNDYVGYEADAGSKYLVLSVTVKNNSKTAETFLPSFSYGDSVDANVYFGEYEYTPTNLLGYDRELHDQTLNPLESLDGDIIFSIPDDVASSTDELILKLTEEGNEISYKVR